jgi:site-specific recombinase XerC
MGAMREAMLCEMALRGLAPRTQHAYVGWMVRLVSKTRVPADQLSESQVRTYLASLSQRGLSASTLNQAINAVRCVSTIVRQPLLAFSEPPREPWPARAA